MLGVAHIEIDGLTLCGEFDSGVVTMPNGSPIARAPCGDCVSIAQGAAYRGETPIGKRNRKSNRVYVVVCLTSTSARNGLAARTVESLRAQSRTPNDIRVYLGPGCDEVSGVTCVRVEDRGPVTKLSAIIDSAVPDDAIIVTADDDTVYDREWLATLIREAEATPEEAVGLSGWNMLPLVQHRRFEAAPVGPCDVLEGFAGVAYRKSFFDADLLAPPTSMLWVDDVWISQYLHRRGIVRRRVGAIQSQSREDLPGLHTRPDFLELNRTAVASWDSTPRVAVCHSAHQRCGIAEYGRQLDEALVANGVTLSTRTFDTFDTYLAKRGVMLVHFEPGLIRPSTLASVRTHRNRGMKIVLCCHYFDEQVLSTWRDAVDRFVIHRSYAMSDPKLVEIPLACPTYAPNAMRDQLRERFGLPKDKLIATTLGFLAPWKRLSEVLDAVLAECPDLFIQVLTPHPFGGTNASEEQAMHNVIRRRDAESRVFFSTEFRPERELLDRVHASDLGFLFHGGHTGSVSAATKQFISARTPLVVTHSTHSQDLGGGVRQVQSFDPWAFAAEIRQVANSAVIDQMRAGVQREYDRLNMSAVAAKYVELFGSLA